MPTSKLIWRSSPPTSDGWYWFKHAGITPRCVHFYRNGYASTALHADLSYLFPRGAVLSFAGPIPEPQDADFLTEPPEFQEDRE